MGTSYPLFYQQSLQKPIYPHKFSSLSLLLLLLLLLLHQSPLPFPSSINETLFICFTFPLLGRRPSSILNDYFIYVRHSCRLAEPSWRTKNKNKNNKAMSCLLPQFKCHPETFSIQFKTPASTITPTPTSSHHHTFLPTANSTYFKFRDPHSLRTQCILSAASPPTLTGTATTFNVDRLKLPPFDTNTDSVSAERLRSYLGAVESSLASTLLTSEEATIAAAAAEAVALAKAAVKAANDAALLVNNSNSSRSVTKSQSSSRSNALHFKWDQFMESERADIIGEPVGVNNRPVEGDALEPSTAESDDMEPTSEELELLEDEFSKSIAVRSIRQTERKARRTRASEKAATSVVSLKSGSSSRKKRNSGQEVDYNDPLRYLRATTSASKLLTASDELELSEGIQDLLKLERLKEELAGRYGNEPTFAQWAAAAGVNQRTLRKRLNYGTFCKDKMIKSNIRLVISIAKNYQGGGMNLQDLVQEGCRGLVRGAEKFDASKGFKFSTYAHWWIKQAVRKSLSDQSRTIRLPFHMVEATYKVKEARKQLYTANGRLPNDEEIAVAAGLSMKRLATVLMTPKAPRSLEQKFGINQNLKPSEVISDPEAVTAEDLLIKQFMKQELEKVLDSLNPRERQIIRWRYGMEDGRMKTLQEIGEMMGVSRERIRQIELCAFRKLKNKKRTKHLQQYLMP
ncbi:RNA polymerase sigma factor sigB [Cucurbita moschata]|uniref:RNA polymerase sigma factor sigB n=1 Tax=Cucurbita moschata TaxID=3662 RepID=A0A6J1HL45_CUCMO|nr:RNA polymerase sigma factor sigB [Cucurbita moschata]